MSDAYTETDVENTVLKLARDQWEGANPEKVQISSRFPEFADGYLYIISVYIKTSSETSPFKEEECYVYRVRGTNKLFRNVNELGIGVGKTVSAFGKLVDSVQKIGISGLIAILITITICSLTIFNTPNMNTDMLNKLYLALTIILGFYFGSVSQKANSFRNESN